MRRWHSKMLKKTVAAVLSVAMVTGTMNLQQTNTYAVDRSKPWLLSTNRPAYSSSVNGGDVASFATDGKYSTQWGAAANKADQWLDVDLGGKADISKVVIDWQNDASFGVAYQVLVSDDEINWKKVYETTTGNGGDKKNVMNKEGTAVDYSYYEDVLSTDSADKKLTQSTGRYVRILINYSKSQAYSDDKKSGWGASIREIEVYGIGDENCVQPVSDAANIALNKEVKVTSYAQPWWAAKALDGSNAVDGDYESYWLSQSQDSVKDSSNQALTVDLKEKHTIGRVKVQWQTEYGKIWDLQVSADGKTWNTVYRNIKGNGEDEDIQLYATDVRYVRVQGILMGRGSGYSIREIQVYDYQEGDEKVINQIPDIPKSEVKKVGKGSYVIDDANLLQPREPKYVTSNIKGAIPSNDWWTSIVYTKYSDTMPGLPMVYKYTSTGLNMYYADGFYTRTENGGMGADSKSNDITIGASNVTGDASAKLDGYGDWSVDVSFSDNDTPKMRSTIVKGSPYVYTTFTDRNAAEINVGNLVKFFDKDGKEILTKDGEKTTIDHFGVESANESEAPGDGNKKQYHYYGVYLPENSTVVKVGSKLKISLGSNENYMVVGSLCVDEPIPLLSNDTVANAETKNDADAVKQLEFMFKHAYSFVTSTEVNYNYNDEKATCTTEYKTIVEQKRQGNGIENTTLMCMMSHQWKYSDSQYEKVNNKALTYTSVRGDLRIHNGNSFSYSQKFNGVIPQYTTPDESDSYDKEWMYAYLEQFTDSALKSYWVADPYWQGKKSHPIAMGILIADQLGEYETRDKLVGVLRKIMGNWLTYDGDEDYPYYMYYHTSWGAISGDGGDHGMAINLSDHHFLWAYFIFPAAVLASYDDTFVNDYGDMIEVLIRDCMNPDKKDEILPFMRNFDVYEGHSWAGGYGDNNSGNNQESASEATFAWAGLYLWGLVTGNDTYKDAGIWGYTSEVNAIEQYWFNMDQGTDLDSKNWAKGYGTNVYGDSNCNVLPYTGMVWGLGYTNGTYFSGNPCCIMGIHLLPVTPAITYMGYRKDTVKKIWSEYEDIQKAYQKKIEKEGAVDPEGWYHILWPFMALSDANGAAERFANEYSSHLDSEGVYRDGVLSTDEMFNSYWYIQNMCAKGYIDTSIWSSDYTSYQIFNKNGKYTAEVWNPFNKEITVHFANENGALGSVKVPAHSTIDCDPTKNEDKTVDKNGNKVTFKKVKNYDPVNKVSGVVEAEDYYTNFSCEPATDANEGGYVGWIDDGDSLIYTLNVKEEGDYVVDYRVQCVNTEKNSAIKLKTDNDSDYILTTSLDNSTTEWKNVKADKTIHLKAGTYKMKLLFVDGGFNLNYIKIYKKGTKAPVATSDDVTTADLSQYPEISLKYAKVIDVTSNANDTNTGDKVIDNDFNTRWESKAEDPQSLTIELANQAKIGGMKIYWEGAAAKKYVVETSTDNKNWSVAFTQNKGQGGQKNGDENRSTGLEAISFDKVMNAKYVRITCTERLTGYGDSIYEVKLYGKGPDQKDKLNAPSVNATLNKDQIKVSWNKVDNAENYIVYRTSPMNTNEAIATVNTTSYTDTDLQENGSYTYWVVAVPKDGSDDYTSSEYSEATETIVYTKTEENPKPENPGEIVVDDKDLAAGKDATASSEEGENVSAKYAVDGDRNTRWSSKFTDDEWISVDLGKNYQIGKVVLTWEAAYGKDYDILVSTDGSNWTTVKEMRDQDGSDDTISFTPVSARYVKMQGVKRGTGYGYSLYSMEVFSVKNGTDTPSEDITGKNLAENKDAFSSSKEGDNVSAKYAVDGNENTRWSSAFNDDEWIYVDLGKSYNVNKVILTWENAYGKDYDIQVSNDGNNWTTVKEMRNQNGGENTAEFGTVSARYVKMQGVKRGTGYGYSLWEIKVYGTSQSASNTTENPTVKPTEKETTTSALSGTNVALGKKTYQSGSEGEAMNADKAVDGNKGTRFSSNFSDDAWMYVDLGKQIDINKVVITWENAYGTDYDVQVSNDGQKWTTVKEMRNQNGGEDTAEFKAVNARYVKFQGIKRVMGYGYSIWEFEVYAQ